MYEESTGKVTDALQNASPTTFTAETIDKILSLTTGNGDTAVSLTEVMAPANGVVTVAAGTEIAYVSAPAGVDLVAPSDVAVVLFQGTTGVTATFSGSGAGSDAGTIDRLVVGTAGSDKIVIDDAKNSHVTAGAGDTIVAGAGSDTIVAGMGNSTIEGGTGYAIVELAGDADDYTVSVVNGHAVVTGNGSTTNISGIQFVQLGDGNAMVFAKDEVEAAVTTLYETTFGRSADAYGLDFWFQMARAGVSLNAIAEGFINSAEYKAEAPVDNSTFVNNLFKQTYGHEATAAQVLEWTSKLSNGFDRADLIESFAAAAAELIADGNGAQVVGQVVIIPGIFG
ncbi:MAG TPA: DUF4214 domain-containing protein [Telluria sp.]|nr:DUF4214 domain-containing protein [Telluria sp.]